MSSEPVRQPANDLIAFDISRQSPEQIVNLFARWKERRKHVQEAGPKRSSRLPHLRQVPPIAHGLGPEAQDAAPAASAGGEPDGPVRYSASFEAVLAAREPTLAQRTWSPDAGLTKLRQLPAPGRRSGMKWVVAGAASVIAITAAAGGALWEQLAGRPGWTEAGDKPAADASLVASPAEAARPAAQTYQTDIPLVEPFVTTAIAVREADWPMSPTVDLALMKAAPVAEAAHLPVLPQLKPPVPAVQTASKAAASPAAKPEAEPQETAAPRVEVPLMPSVTTATVSVPVAPAPEARKDDPRPGGRRGDDNSFGSNNHMASSGSKSVGASGSSGSAEPGSGNAGGGTGGDPGSGGTGGDSGGSTGGGDTGDGDAGDGDTGGGDSGGGDAGGGSGDAGDFSGGGSGDDSGGDGSEGGGSGEGGESGQSGEGGAAGDGGIGGAIDGALGGIGGALGDAVGGGKGSAKGDKSKDKDQR